ncbi:unnamed protein product [Urochloa humidicola]
MEHQRWLPTYLDLPVAGAHPGLALRDRGEDTSHISRWICFHMLLLRDHDSEVYDFLCKKKKIRRPMNNESEQFLRQEQR